MSLPHNLATLPPQGLPGENLVVATTVAASATIGAGAHGTVTVTADTAGAAGNDFTIEVVVGVGNNVPLAAALVGDAITVTLATDGSGDPNDAANTATLVAAAVAALTGVTAAASGTGATALDAAEAEQNFTGGVSSYGLAGTPAASTTHFLVTVGPQPVRATFDATHPTASTGHYLPAGWEGLLPKAAAVAARFIRAGGTSSDVHFTPCAAK